MCWRGVCAGMTLAEVKSRLEFLGYDVDTRWLARLLGRFMPGIGGVYDFEAHSEWISARRGAECSVDVPKRESCASLTLGFVRFPSGRLRLYSFDGTETVPSVRYAADVIDGLRAAYGDPDREGWKRAPRWTLSNDRWTMWEGAWSGEQSGEWLKVGLHVNDELAVENDRLLPPALSRSLKIDSIDHSFNSLPTGFEAESAWIAEDADWIEDPQTKCRVWNPFPRDTDTIRWEGDCNRGYATGEGSVHWYEHGQEYEVDSGEFRNGKLNGHGVVTMRLTGVRFEGEFLDHLPHGEGVLEKDGRSYSGEWVKGCLSVDGHSIAFFTHRDLCEHY
ncbi:MAG: hypothetical protein P8Z78_06870 [Gammaproteobacteria bacterium]